MASLPLKDCDLPIVNGRDVGAGLDCEKSNALASAVRRQTYVIGILLLAFCAPLGPLSLVLPQSALSTLSKGGYQFICLERYYRIPREIRGYRFAARRARAHASWPHDGRSRSRRRPPEGHDDRHNARRPRRSTHLSDSRQQASGSNST